MLISGSCNGEIVIWGLEYKNVINQLSECKVIFRDKLVIHEDQINNMTINSDLRVAVITSRDGYISIIDIVKCEPIRMIKLGIPVTHK